MAPALDFKAGAAAPRLAEALARANVWNGHLTSNGQFGQQDAKLSLGQ